MSLFTNSTISDINSLYMLMTIATLPSLYSFFYCIGAVLIFRRVNIPLWKAFVPFLAWKELVTLSGAKESWKRSYFFYSRQLTVYTYIFDGFGMARYNDLGKQMLIIFCAPLYLIMAGLCDSDYVPMGQRVNLEVQKKDQP